MKILVVSDTHGNVNLVLQNIVNMEKSDMLFHLGDYVDDAEKISKLFGIPTITVRGNGDMQRKDYKYEELVEIQGKKIFLTHGHKYNVKQGLNNLYYRALELNADIVLFGHTHVPMVEEIDGLIIMNPGSPTYPRGIIRKNTIGVLTIDQIVEGKIIEIK